MVRGRHCKYCDVLLTKNEGYSEERPGVCSWCINWAGYALLMGEKITEDLYKKNGQWRREYLASKASK